MKHSGYINEPKTIEDFEQNIQFQLDNVAGWVSVRNYESALVKARLLVAGLELIVKQNLPEKDQY